MNKSTVNINYLERIVPLKDCQIKLDMANIGDRLGEH